MDVDSVVNVELNNCRQECEMLKDDVQRLSSQLTIVMNQKESIQTKLDWSYQVISATNNALGDIQSKMYESEGRLSYALGAFNSVSIDYKRMVIKHKERSQQLALARLEIQKLQAEIESGPISDEERVMWRNRCLALKKEAEAKIEKQNNIWSKAYAALSKKMDASTIVKSKQAYDLNELEKDALSGMLVLEANRIQIQENPSHNKRRRSTRSYIKESGYVPLDFHELNQISDALKPKRSKN